MRKPVFSFLAILMVAFLAPTPASAGECTKIGSGLITASNGVTLTRGYDEWGYNYGAGVFNGFYENSARPIVPVAESDIKLVMKWSSDWMSATDCNGDGKLDRGYDPKTGSVSGISMGWTTNHMEGAYIGSDGNVHHWSYFVKIVYVGPAPVASPDPWAGNRIWEQYAVIQELQNDKFGEYGGSFREKLSAPGLGRF